MPNSSNHGNNKAHMYTNARFVRDAVKSGRLLFARSGWRNTVTVEL